MRENLEHISPERNKKQKPLPVQNISKICIYFADTYDRKKGNSIRFLGRTGEEDLSPHNVALHNRK